MEFKKISDELVEVIDDCGESTVVTMEEAVELGYIELTYKGKPCTYKELAKLTGRHIMSVHHLVHKYGYTTVEEVLAHYNKLDEQKYTYKGKIIKLKELEPITGKSASTMSAVAVSHGFNTGEQIVDYYAGLSENVFTYQGKEMSIEAFAKLINRKAANLVGIARRNNIHTGEELLEHLKVLDSKLRGIIIYKGKQIKIAEFAELVDRDPNYIAGVANKVGKNGEDIIDYLNKIKAPKPTNFTYKGKPIYIDEIGKLVGKSGQSVAVLAKTHRFNTAEEIIDYYNTIGVTYKGERMQLSELAERTGISVNVLRRLAREHNNATGDELVGLYYGSKQKEKEKKSLTYNGEHYTYDEFARKVGIEAGRVKYAAQTFGYNTGEEILVYLNDADSKKRVFTYKGKTIGIRAFAREVHEQLGVSERSIRGLLERRDFSTGEQVIEYIENSNFMKRRASNVKGKNTDFTYKGVKISRAAFAKKVAPILGVSDTSIKQNITDNKFTTGEEVIEHYNSDEYRENKKYNGRPFFYNEQQMTVVDFAKLISEQCGLPESKIISAVYSHKFNTGEELLDFFRSRGYIK